MNDVINLYDYLDDIDIFHETHTATIELMCSEARKHKIITNLRMKGYRVTNEKDNIYTIQRTEY